MSKKTFMKKSLLAATLASSLFCLSLPAQAAATMGQNCDLGNTCPIPGEDGGQTDFVVKPSDGMEYKCEIKSDGGSLRFYISAGQDFKLTQGDGFYTANPEAIVELKGRFRDPNNINSQGLIKITKMPLSADGKVKCYAKQSS